MTMDKWTVKITNEKHEVRIYIVSDVYTALEALRSAMTQYNFTCGIEPTEVVVKRGAI